MKAHVIVKKGYEYDDNIYSESEGGNPELICFSKEDADKKVNELNKEEFKTTSLIYYSYELEDILNVDIEEYEKFNQSLVEKYGKITKKNSWDDPENTLQIIPMDSKTANGVKDLLRTSGLNDDKLSRITVGANCDTNGVCEYESAEAPDPFFARGTRFENKAYYNTSKGLSEFIPAKVLQQTPNPQFFNRNPKYKTQKNNFNSGR